MRHHPKARRRAPRLGPGVCRFCGCSEFDPCLDVVASDVGGIPRGCAWTDATRKVCTECSPAAKAEALVLDEQASAKGREISRSRPVLAVFHRGFVAGWFNVKIANPYKLGGVVSYARIWAAARMDGDNERAVYIRNGGRITNEPRAFILKRPAPR